MRALHAFVPNDPARLVYEEASQPPLAGKAVLQVVDGRDR